MNIQKTLLRREFWEHKGGFFWTPVIACALFLVISVGGMIAGSIAAHRAAEHGQFHVHGQVVRPSDLGAVMANLPAHQQAQLGEGFNLSLMMASGFPFLALTFVGFFYCISAMYDERRDRSILFWKSMPVSDRDTVISKALSALVMAPVLALGVGLVSMLMFYVCVAGFIALHGANPWVVMGGANPLTAGLNMVALLPVYCLSALPTAGWLLLCSAVARSKPFLLAVVLPVMAGVVVSATGLMQGFGVGDGWFWKNIVARALLGFAPGSWLNDASAVHGSLLSLGGGLQGLASPSLWVGAIAGVGMLVGASFVRRWKDEG